MERVALHTRLRPGHEDDYDRVHATVPPKLEVVLREAGVHSWRIWRTGRELFHVLEVEDHRAMRHALRDHPENTVRQARMAELLEVEDDCSGRDSGIGLVWELP